MAPKLKYRKTTVEDLPDVMPIYENARRFMVANGNPDQWINGYPAVEHIKADIDRGVSYVGVTQSGEIAVVFSFILGDDPTYAVIEGEWLNSEPYGTIHRIASAGIMRNVGDDVIEFCASMINNLRADTHYNNHVMQQLLLRNGFSHCGTIYLLDGRPRLAYHREKVKFQHQND